MINYPESGSLKPSITDNALQNASIEKMRQIFGYYSKVKCRILSEKFGVFKLTNFTLCVQ